MRYLALFPTALLVFVLEPQSASAAVVTSTFEESSLTSKLNALNVYEGETEAASSFRSGNVTFINDGVFFGGTSWSGVGISQKTVRTSANFFDEGDDLISRPLTGSGSATWGVVFSEGIVTADAGNQFLSVDVANTLWTFDLMENGGPFVGGPFGKGGGTGRFAGQDDFFTMRFTNTASSQFLEVNLADFRGASDFIRDDWSTVDLSSLNAGQLSITLLGSRETSFDGGQTYFQDIPSYVAIDNLAVTVPEPQTATTLLALGTWFFLRRRPAAP